MTIFILKKIRDMIITILIVSILSFLLIRMVPGDPVMLLLGERGSDPQLYQEMKQKLGLHLPIHIQYLNFIKKALHGDIGNSIITKRPVSEEFFDRFPATLELGICAIFFAILLGIPIGIIASIKRNTFIDYSLMSCSLFGYSIPIFWWALMLILLFSVYLGITPVSGRISVLFDIETITGFYLIDTLREEVIKYEGLSAFKSAVSHLILPTIALGTIPLALIARMTRSSMLEVLDEDYIKTAKAKGLSYHSIIINHALRNALIPIITLVGLIFGSIITGAILTETIFSWSGIGKWLVISINARDYPVIQGGVLFIAIAIILINNTVDICYALVNPRIKNQQ